MSITIVNGNDVVAANVPPILPRSNDLEDQSYRMIFKYLIPVSLATVAVKYQGKNVDPFEAYPIAMWTFFGSTSAFYLLPVMINEMHYDHEHYCRELKQMALIIGTLSWSALATTLLPPKLWWLAVVVWFVLAIIIARNFLLYLWGYIVEGCFHIYMFIKGISTTVFMKWFEDASTLPITNHVPG